MFDPAVASRRVFHRAAAPALSVAVCLTACDPASDTSPRDGARPGVGGSGGAQAGSAGAPTAGGAPAAGAGGQAGDFELLYRDDFETLDPARWQLMTHSWDSNLALFSAQTVAVAGGHLTLSLTPAPEGTTDSSGAPKSFLGAEVRSTDALTYGRVRARAKFAKGSAVVSSLVTIYTPWPADDWNELDVEYLGMGSNEIQFNTMVYTGPPVAKPVAQSVTPTQAPHLQALDFVPSEDFHVYAIEWTPEGAAFLVDDVLAYEWDEHIDLMTLPQNVLLTIWASSSAAWAGPVTADTGAAVATYDWIELYSYAP